MAEYSDYAWDWRRNLPPLPTIFGGAFDREPPSVAPMTTQGVPVGTAPAVPILPDIEKNRPLVPPGAGPGYAPGLVGNPVGTALQPGLGDFGKPVPNAADGKPAETEEEAKRRILKAYLESKDFSGALGAIGKGMAKKPAGPMAPAFHVSGASRMGGGKDLGGAGGAYMQRAIEEMAGPKYDLTIPVGKRKPGQQDRYDILRGRG